MYSRGLSCFALEVRVSAVRQSRSFLHVCVHHFLAPRSVRYILCLLYFVVCYVSCPLYFSSTAFSSAIAFICSVIPLVSSVCIQKLICLIAFMITLTFMIL
jgi:hypothetical protein